MADWRRRLRSLEWFRRSPSMFGNRSRMMQNGYSPEEFSGRPVIAIINTWSGLNTCHGHLRDVAQVVSRGILQAGGLPVELPAMSVSEMLVRPTAMLYRNFLAMETEELLRSHPVDGAVLLGGCDKTTPGLLMGAISVDLPTIFVPAGFMLHGLWRGQRLGSGVDAWTFGPQLKRGEIDLHSWFEIEQGSARTVGTCNTMGTASTMTAIAEALGMALPLSSSVPAVDALQRRLAHQAGGRIVAMVEDELRPSAILTQRAFENGAAVCCALGGSTNALIHLIALARRAGAPFSLDDFNRIAEQVPVLADVQPSGSHLMEDFFEAGGLPALMQGLAPMLDLGQPTVSGRSVGQNIAAAEVVNPHVIRPLDQPFSPRAFSVLKGNIAPGGCVIKTSAASPDLLQHRGRAVVFEDYADLKRRIHSPTLDVVADDVLVLRNAGPVGGPGMPEWGMIPIPEKLLRAGVKDMVRISDARMSGTSFGTVVLHICPEAFVGGPLGLVKTGDVISLDAHAGTLNVEVSEEALLARASSKQPQPLRKSRGYEWLFTSQVMQADEGCDFRFLGPAQADPVQ